MLAFSETLYFYWTEFKIRKVNRNAKKTSKPDGDKELFAKETVNKIAKVNGLQIADKYLSGGFYT